MANGLTQLLVYNRALDALGSRTQLLTTSDPGPECSVLGTNFPNAFNLLLQKHDWSFARIYSYLTAITTPSQLLAGWAGTYAVPSNCLLFLGIFNGRRWGTMPVVPFELAFNGVAGGVVGTDFPTPQGVSTLAMTDPSQTSPLFCEALVYALAAISALDITGSAQLGPALETVSGNHLQAAIERDGAQRRVATATRYDPSWIRDRQ